MAYLTGDEIQDLQIEMAEVKMKVDAMGKEIEELKKALESIQKPIVEDKK